MTWPWVQHSTVLWYMVTSLRCTVVHDIWWHRGSRLQSDWLRCLVFWRRREKVPSPCTSIIIVNFGKRSRERNEAVYFVCGIAERNICNWTQSPQCWPPRELKLYSYRSLSFAASTRSTSGASHVRVVSQIPYHTSTADKLYTVAAMQTLLTIVPDAVELWWTLWKDPGSSRPSMDSVCDVGWTDSTCVNVWASEGRECDFQVPAAWFLSYKKNFESTAAQLVLLPWPGHVLILSSMYSSDIYLKTCSLMA